MEEVMMGWTWRWVLGVVLVAIGAVMGTEMVWWRPKRVEMHFAKQGIKGPKYCLFIGNVKEMVTSMLQASSKPMIPSHSHNILPRVLPFYHQWKKIYGSTFLLWFGPTPRLAVADPDLIREIFVSRSDAFDRYESHPMVRQLEGEGLVSLHGDKWAHHRRLLTPTFHMDNLKLLIPFVAKTVQAMADQLLQAGGDVEVDVSEWFQTVTEDAITRTAFGRSYDDGKAVFQLQARQMVFAAEAFRKVFIPGYRFLPTKRNKASWRLDKEIRKNLVGLIGRRRASRDDDHFEYHDRADGSPRDLLGQMIGASASGAAPRASESCQRHSSAAITVGDIVEECKTFFFAGKQTTSNLLTWTTVLLAMHPEWQERARGEVFRVCGARDIPSREQLTKLKTVAMILNETLRLYPPAVATIRRAKVDAELAGGRVRIPRDTELLIPILAVHHDTRLWGPDASQFNPAHFAEGAAVSAQRHPAAFIPFGMGSRMCIGKNLALLEARLTIAILLQRFTFLPSPSYVHAPTVLMLLYPQFGAPVLFRPLIMSS